MEEFPVTADSQDFPSEAPVYKPLTAAYNPVILTSILLIIPNVIKKNGYTLLAVAGIKRSDKTQISPKSHKQNLFHNLKSYECVS